MLHRHHLPVSLCARISLKLFAFVCMMGDHSTFLKSACTFIGIYVSMKMGKVKV